MTRQRSFLAYDGEGANGAYTLLANTRHDIYSPTGLSTIECLKFLAQNYKDNPIRVFFSFGYDVAFITRDLDEDSLLRLYHDQEVEFSGFRLRLIKRKLLTIRAASRKYTYFDVYSFFQSSFVNALENVLGECPEIIRAGKSARADFAAWKVDEVKAYNRAECVYLEKLCERLRAACSVEFADGVDLMPNAWYGPGAIANKVHRVLETARHVYPERSYSRELQSALCHAYYGGRFECLKLGTFAGPVYRYDIRSAYPHAMSRLPVLTWRWKHVFAFQPDKPFGLYRVTWDMRQSFGALELPGPFPIRSANGSISFPADGEGWYWAPEVKAAQKFYAGVRVIEGWVMSAGDILPYFEPVNCLYTRRADLKSAGDARQLALKLAINSLYGKFVQTVGRNRYFSLCYGGYITSLTRARVLSAMLQTPLGVIAVMTDGLLSTARLQLPLGEGLGYWEETEFERGATILQNGVYELRQEKGAPVVHYRGFRSDKIDVDDLCAQIRATGAATILERVFVGPLQALLMPDAYGPHRLKFIQVTRQLAPFAEYKRHYYLPPAAREGHFPDLRAESVSSRAIFSPPGCHSPVSYPYGAYERDEREDAFYDALDGAAFD